MWQFTDGIQVLTTILPMWALAASNAVIILQSIKHCEISNIWGEIKLLNAFLTHLRILMYSSLIDILITSLMPHCH
ncbi:hypothetical protein GCM10027037_35020 [Mucilaginibacter koreensis]